MQHPTYEIPEGRRTMSCAAQGCEARLVWLPNVNGVGLVPVNAATRQSHFLDCKDPGQFSAKRRREAQALRLVAPTAPTTMLPGFE